MHELVLVTKIVIVKNIFMLLNTVAVQIGSGVGNGFKNIKLEEGKDWVMSVLWRMS